MTAEGGWRRGCVRLPFALVGGWLVRRTAEGCFETTAEGCVCVCDEVGGRRGRDWRGVERCDGGGWCGEYRWLVMTG